MFGFGKKKVEEPKEVSLIKKYDNKYKGVWKKPSIDRDAMFKALLPRTFSDIAPVTKNGQVAAMDSAFKMPSVQNDIPDRIFEFYGSHSFIGWNACAILRQNPYINLACTIPAQDAIQSDYRLNYGDNNENFEKVDEQKLVDIKKASDDEFHIKDICYRLNVNKKTFGIGLAFPLVEGADYSKPFNIDGIKKGSYRGFTIVEPYWVAPQLDADAVSNPASPCFYDPTWWRLPNGQLVHRSWCIKVVNNILPDILKPVYYYGGVPLTQMLYERVYAAEKVANEAPLMALTKRMLVADADVNNLIANPEEAQNIIEAVKWCRDNFGVWFKNSGDQVVQIDTSLSDFDALIMTQYQLVASIAEMPATKLLKTQPKGFNATGEYEQKDYIQTLQSIQERDYLPLINLHNLIYTKSTYGTEINLNVVFNPIDMPTEKEVAETAEIYSRIDANYINSGVLGAGEVRNINRSNVDSRYSTLTEEMDGESEALPPFEDIGGGEKTSDVALNGAQVNGIINIIQQYQSGLLSKESAAEILRTSFKSPEESIEKMLITKSEE